MQPIWMPLSPVNDTLMHTVLAWVLKLADKAVAKAAAAGITMHVTSIGLDLFRRILSIFSHDI